LAKFKTPGDYIISSLRGLQISESYADKARVSFALARPAHLRSRFARGLAGFAVPTGRRIRGDEAH